MNRIIKIGVQPLLDVNKEGKVYNSLEALKLLKFLYSRSQTFFSTKSTFFRSLIKRNQAIVKNPSPLSGLPAFKGFENGKCTLSAEGLVVRLYCSISYTFGSASCRKLWDAVFKGVTDDFPFSPDEAKDLRLKLMDERKALVIRHDEAFKGLDFSLCGRSHHHQYNHCWEGFWIPFFSSLFLYRKILSINEPEYLYIIYLLNISALRVSALPIFQARFEEFWSDFHHVIELLCANKGYFYH